MTSGSMRCMFWLSLVLLAPRLRASPEEDSPSRAPDFLVELYHKFSQGIGEVEEDEKNSNKIITFYRTEKPVAGEKYLPQRAKLTFNISSFEEIDEILGANLRLFVPQMIGLVDEADYSTVLFTLMTSCRTKVRDKTDKLLKYTKVWKHNKQIRYQDTNRWIKMKVTSAEKALGLFGPYRFLYHFDVQCVISINQKQRLPPQFKNNIPIFSTGKAPALVVFVNNKKSKTFKKMIEDNKRHFVVEEPNVRLPRQHLASGKKLNCHKEDMYIDFKELGWHKTIVYPSGLNAYKCVGVCPYPLSSSIPHTDHSFLQNAYHKKFPDRVDAPCCVPDPEKLETTSLMYQAKDNSIVMKTYDSVVGVCGCL